MTLDVAIIAPGGGSPAALTAFTSFQGALGGAGADDATFSPLAAHPPEWQAAKHSWGPNQRLAKSCSKASLSASSAIAMPWCRIAPNNALSQGVSAGTPARRVL